MNRLPIILLLCMAIYSPGQTNFSPGYVVKTSGDTLRGYLQEELRNQLVFQVQFKANINNPSFKTLSLKDIDAFNYASGDSYRKITFRNTLPDSGYQETVFALILVKGSYNLYSFILKEETYFIVEGNGTSYFLYNSTFNGNGAIITEGNYTSRLGVLAAACTRASLNPEQLNFNEKDLSKFVFDLNNCISPNSATINLYQKPKTTSQFALFAGGMILGKNENQASVDAALRLTYPQLSNNVSINVGFHYSRSNRIQHDIDENYNHFEYLFNDEIICVPLTLQYYFKFGPVHPYVSGGFAASHLSEKNTTTDYYSVLVPPENEFGISVIAAIGIEWNIKDNLYAKTEWRYEFFIQYPIIGIAYIF